MKFRIKHLLVATVVVAIFAWALAAPTDTMVIALKYSAWITALVLIIRAVTHKSERLVISMGLLASVSYFPLTWWELQWQDETTLIAKLVEKVHSKYMPVPNRTGVVDVNSDYWNSISIGEIAFSVLFGLLAAGLAAYWTREKHEAS